MLYDSELQNFDDLSESVSVTSAIAKQIDNFDSDVDLQVRKNPKGAPNVNMRMGVSSSASDNLDLSSAKSGDSSFAKKKKGEKASVLRVSKDSVSSRSYETNSDVSSMNINESVFNQMNSDVSVDFRKRKGKK